MITVSLEPKWRHFAQVNIADIFMLSSKLPKQNEINHSLPGCKISAFLILFVGFSAEKAQLLRTWKIHLENKLLLISINFTPKTSHSCLKLWYTMFSGQV